MGSEGAEACSLGREPQVDGFTQTQSPEGATAVFLGAMGRRPFGAWDSWASASLGLTPQATCLGSFGAQRLLLR